MTEPQDTRLVAPALVVWGIVAGFVSATAGQRLGVAAACVLLAGYGLWRGLRAPRRVHAARWPRPSAALVLAAVAGLAAVTSLLVADGAGSVPALTGAIGRGSVTVTVRIDGLARPVAASAGNARFVIAATVLTVDGEPARGPVVLVAGAEWSALAPGVQVQTAARVRPTEAERELALLVPTEPPTQTRAPPAWQEWTNRLREGLREAVTGLPPHASGLIPGVALGDDSQVPRALSAAMRATALGHLLAVSGAHVAVILALLQLLTQRAALAVRLAVSVTAVLGLVALVGPEPSVVRAAGMATVALLAQLLGRPSAAIPALASTVVVLVLLDPWISREPGFALSVLATAGIVWWSKPWSAALAERMGRAGFLAPVIALPAAAQVACLPVLLTMDPALATYGVVANALVAPVIPALTLLALAATVCSPWAPGAAHALAWLAQTCTWWIEQVATRAAQAPLAQLPWPAPPSGIALALALAAAGWWLVRSGRARSRLAVALRRAGPVLALSVAAALTTLALVPATRPATAQLAGELLPGGPPPDWRVLVCDVGQGTAVLISTAEGGGGPSAVMVDVGGPDGRAVECLRRAGVSRVELLALTHADLDHVGGLEEVSGAVVIDEVVVPVTADPRMDDAVARLREAGIGVRALTTGDPPWRSSQLELMPVWPTPREVELATSSGDPDRVVNDLSLTLWVSAPDLTVLVNGDLGEAAQAALARALGPAVPRPDVLVVAHHGSADQDAGLLQATAGAVSVISVGADNDYGHPAQRTLDLLAGTGTLLRRTDQCGDVTLRRREGVLEVTRCG